MREPGKLFVFGLGYVGLRLGIAAQNAGYDVCGTVRSEEKAAAIAQATGIAAHTFDLDDSYSGLSLGGLAALAEATHLVVTVPPLADFDRDPLLALHEREVLDAASTDGQLRWAGYLSTTSVYGNHDGAWVDECSETRAAAGSAGDNRLAAERAWLDLEGRSEGRLRSRVFRLAGIYGPGRSALDTVSRAAAKSAMASRDESAPDETVTAAAAAAPPNPAAATPSPPSAAIRSDGQKTEQMEGPVRYVSRIHVDDICGALLASMAQSLQPSSPSQKTSAADDRGGDPRIFNVADDDPAPREEVMALAAELLGLPTRAALDATGAPSGGGGGRARRRAVERKRVANGRLRADLLPDGLKWPSYREGLRGILSDANVVEQRTQTASPSATENEQ